MGSYSTLGACLDLGLPNETTVPSLGEGFSTTIALSGDEYAALFSLLQSAIVIDLVFHSGNAGGPFRSIDAGL